MAITARPEVGLAKVEISSHNLDARFDPQESFLTAACDREAITHRTSQGAVFGTYRRIAGALMMAASLLIVAGRAGPQEATGSITGHVYGPDGLSLAGTSVLVSAFGRA